MGGHLDVMDSMDRMDSEPRSAARATNARRNPIEPHEAHGAHQAHRIRQPPPAQLAAAAAKLGLACHLAMVKDHKSASQQGNLLLDDLFGAEVEMIDVPTQEQLDDAKDNLITRLKAEGRKASVAYIMGGDPDHDRSLALMQGLPAAGVDVIEIGLPFQFALMGGDQSGAWMALFGLLWSGVFLLFPIFNRDKMRVGDLIAGTWVIKAPRAKLMEDITSTAARPDISSRFAFTPAQTQAYGIHELHVLEDVLRQSTSGIKAQVAARIRAKINWVRTESETALLFLEAYYAALRRRLEQRMLPGERKSDKFDVR